MKQAILGMLALFSLQLATAQNLLWTKPAAPAGQDVYSVSFSDDGNRIFTGTECTPAYLRIFETATSNVLWDYEMAGGHLCVSGVSFSSDGKKAAAMEEMGNLLLFDYTGSTPALLNTVQTGTNYAFSLDFSPDGTKLVTGCGNKKMIIYNADGSVANTVEAHTNWVQAVDWSATDKIASGGDDNLVKIWDAGGNLVHTLTGHGNAVQTLRFSKDGQYLVTGSKDKTVKLWDVNTGALVRTFTGHTGEVKQVDVSDDGKHIVSGSADGKIKVWNLETGAELMSFMKDGAGIVYSVDFSPNGRYVIAGTQNGDVQFWDLAFASNVTAANAEETVIVYPNPVSDQLFVRSADKVAITITDAAGRVMYFNSEVKNEHVNVQGFAPGHYTVMINDGKLTRNVKLLIQ